MYSTLIAEAIGTADPATVTVVEEIMRTDRTGLDGLTRAQFDRLARVAYGDMALLASAGALGEYCEALAIETPATVRI